MAKKKVKTLQQMIEELDAKIEALTIEAENEHCSRKIAAKKKRIKKLMHTRTALTAILDTANMMIDVVTIRLPNVNTSFRRGTADAKRTVKRVSAAFNGAFAEFNRIMKT